MKRPAYQKLITRIMDSPISTDDKIKILFPRPKILKIEESERQALVVNGIEKSGATLEEIGNIFGITRERVRQIYKARTGHGVGIKYAINHSFDPKEMEEKIKELRKVRMEQIKCIGCGKEVVQINTNQVYCSDCHALLKIGRDPKTFFNCINCKNDFHPNRNWKSMKTAKNKYCSMSCYWTSRKK